MIAGTTTFVVISALKVATMLGVCIGFTTGLQYFHNFKFKPKKKEKGVESDGTKLSTESLREKSRQIS